jgi:hypothetical protein
MDSDIKNYWNTRFRSSFSASNFARIRCGCSSANGREKEKRTRDTNITNIIVVP